MPQIVLGQRFQQGDRLTPTLLNDLVDRATVTGFAAADFNLASLQFFTYGNTRPTLTRGAAHYDTTSGLEGMYFSYVSASNASVTGWLCATPRRESYCWAASAVSAYTPVFVGKPSHVSGSPEYNIYDGCLFPYVWQYSGASGPDAAMFVTLESVGNDKPVKCMWAGLIPDANLFSGATSQASIGSPLFVDYTDGGAFKAGRPTSKNFIVGVNTLNGPSGAGAILWGTGPCIEDIA